MLQDVAVLVMCQCCHRVQQILEPVPTTCLASTCTLQLFSLLLKAGPEGSYHLPRLTRPKNVTGLPKLRPSFHLTFGFASEPNSILFRVGRPTRQPI